MTKWLLLKTVHVQTTTQNCHVDIVIQDIPVKTREFHTLARHACYAPALDDLQIVTQKMALVITVAQVPKVHTVRDASEGYLIHLIAHAVYLDSLG